MAFKYKIIKHIATLSETQDESKQVNIISYNNSKPKIDIRNWFDDDKMGKGITLDDEEWEMLKTCFEDVDSNSINFDEILDSTSWLNKLDSNEYKINLEDFGIDVECETEFEVDLDEQAISYSITFKMDRSKVQKHIEFINDCNKYFADNEICANTYIDFISEDEFIKTTGRILCRHEDLEASLDDMEQFLYEMSDDINEIGAISTRQIRFEDVIVIGDRLACIHENHQKEELIVAVDFIKKGSIIRVESKAFHCKKCNLYFMRAHDYQKMKTKGAGGSMLCQEITEEIYMKNPKALCSDLNIESIIHKHGYNVSDGMTNKERRQILEYIVDSSIVSKEHVASHLAFLIRLNRNKSNHENAINKWDDDRNYMLDYNVDSRRKIEPGRITVIKYKPQK